MFVCAFVLGEKDTICAWGDRVCLHNCVCACVCVCVCVCLCACLCCTCIKCVLSGFGVGDEGADTVHFCRIVSFLSSLYLLWPTVYACECVFVCVCVCVCVCVFVNHSRSVCQRCREQ